MITLGPDVQILAYESVMVVAQNQSPGTPGYNDNPLGPEFGKASPIGLLVLAVLGVAVISLGWAFHRRFSRYNRRRAFAEANGLDVFDQEAVDRAMEEAGLLDRRKKSWF